eukprot:6166369-Prymnesium_polylepis.1
MARLLACLLACMAAHHTCSSHLAGLQLGQGHAVQPGHDRRGAGLLAVAVDGAQAHLCHRPGVITPTMRAPALLEDGPPTPSIRLTHALDTAHSRARLATPGPVGQELQDRQAGARHARQLPRPERQGVGRRVVAVHDLEAVTT